jgi:glycosyltransferase involved in cell wall biosynthesis
VRRSVTGTYFSVVIPVFNRDWCVNRASESAISSLVRAGVRGEILLVNDGSTDNSRSICMVITDKYKDCTSIDVKLINHEKNLGVCAAKNTGAKNATGTWLIFLDSDDEMLETSVLNIKEHLSRYDVYPLHFFAAVRDHEDHIKEKCFSEVLSIKEYLNGTNGFEAMPVVRREAFIANQYDEDLSGYESLSYARITTLSGFCVKHPVVVRVYHTEHADRLSSPSGMAKRYRSLLVGHKRFLRENLKNFTFLGLVRHLARIVKCSFLIVYCVYKNKI